MEYRLVVIKNFYVIIFGAKKRAINCFTIDFIAVLSRRFRILFRVAVKAASSLPNVFIVSENDDRPGVASLQQLPDDLVKIGLLVVVRDLQGLCDADST